MPGKYARRKKFPLIPVLIAVAAALALLAITLVLLASRNNSDAP